MRCCGCMMPSTSHWTRRSAWPSTPHTRWATGGRRRRRHAARFVAVLVLLVLLRLLAPVHIGCRKDRPKLWTAGSAPVHAWRPVCTLFAMPHCAGCRAGGGALGGPVQPGLPPRPAVLPEPGEPHAATQPARLVRLERGWLAAVPELAPCRSAGWVAGASPCSAPGWHPCDPLLANHTTARPDPAGGCTACRCSWPMARCCWRCGLPGCLYPAHQRLCHPARRCLNLPVTLPMHPTCHPRRCATCWARCSSVWRATRATAACSTRWRIPSRTRRRGGWRVRSAPSAWTSWR